MSYNKNVKRPKMKLEARHQCLTRQLVILWQESEVLYVVNSRIYIFRTILGFLAEDYQGCKVAASVLYYIAELHH